MKKTGGTPREAAGTEEEKTRYRDAITDMAGQIDDLTILARLYTLAHHLYMHCDERKGGI